MVVADFFPGNQPPVKSVVSRKKVAGKEYPGVGPDETV